MFKLPSLFIKKNYPEFYKSYLESIENRYKKKSLREIPFVSFDTETTGLDVKEDRILSIGAVRINDNKIYVENALELYLEQEVFNYETVSIHGILKSNKYTKVTEAEAIQQFLNFIGGAVLIGHHVGFDIALINNALKRMGLPKLRNTALDTAMLYKKTIHQVNILSQEKVYSLDEVCEDLKISREDRHKAAGDALITAMAFLKIKARLSHKGYKTLNDLQKWI